MIQKLDLQSIFCVLVLTAMPLSGCQKSIGDCDPTSPNFGGGDGSIAQPYRLCSNVQLKNVSTCLTCSSVTGEDFLGLFSIISGSAVVKNLGVMDVKISGRSQLGALVGAADGNSSISGCSSSGRVTGDSVNGFEVGGLVGVMRTSGSVSDSASSAIVSGGKWVGGLVGQNSFVDSTIKNVGSIIHSHATGNVSSTAGATGGLIGVAYYGFRISTSYATGNVSSGGAPVGGLVGLLAGYAPTNSSIIDSFASGSVTVGTDLTSPNTKNYAGGALVGSLEAGPLTITRAFGLGTVSGGTVSLNGGLTGVCVYGPSSGCATVMSSFWNTATTGLATSPFGTGLNTSALQSPTAYPDWDFDKVWNSPAAGSYPTLK